MTVGTVRAAGAVRRGLRALMCLAVLAVPTAPAVSAAQVTPAAERYAGLYADVRPNADVRRNVGVGPRAGADPYTHADSATYPVRVALLEISPVLPKSGDTLTVSGVLTNASTRQLVGTHLGERVDTRDEIAAHTEDVEPLSPGEQVPFTLSVPVSALGLGESGDHRLDVSLTGQDGTVFGRGTTRLPWSPESSDGKPLDVAAIWPLTDAPHMEAVSLGWGDDAQPVYRNDDLTAEFAKGGRLRDIVAAPSGLPVTWTVDPSLLDEARGMTGGYRVAVTPDGGDPQSSREGNGGTAASTWLTALRDAVKGGDVVALPYADPDLAALAHTGTGGSVLGSVLHGAVRWGSDTASNVLRVPVRDDVAWPYGGALDTGITELAGSLGARTYLASGLGLSTGTARSRVSLGDDTAAVVGDSEITDALSGPMTGPDDQMAARQSILGALLTARLSAQRHPSRGDAGLLVIPPRDLSGPAAGVLASALRVARAAGWIHLVGLDDLAAGPDDPPPARVAGSPPRIARTGASGDSGSASGTGSASGAVGTVHASRTYPRTGSASDAVETVHGSASAPRTASASAPPTPSDTRVDSTPPSVTKSNDANAESYPQALRISEPSADDVTAVAAIQPDLGTLSRVLADPGRTTDAVHRAMLRAVSTGWRVAAEGGDATDQKSYTGGVRAYVDDSITSVHLLPKRGTVTMAGDAASIPITVANGLQQPLGGLRLRVTSSAPNRVTVSNPVTVVRAPPAANHTEQVKVRANANGPVEITAQLYTTANNRPWGDPVTFRIKVSRVSPLVVGVIAGGVLMVLLAGALQMRRVRRRDARAATGGGRR